MNKQRAKTFGIFLIKLAGTSLFLWLALSQIEDKKALGENFASALQSPLWVAGGLALALLALLAGALRWFLLLRVQAINVPFTYIFRLTLYAAFFNIASFGGAAGDAAKIVLLMRRVPEKKIQITMSVMADHVIGFISSSIIFLVFTWGFGTLDGVEEIGKNTFVAATWLQAAGLLAVVLTVVSCLPAALSFGSRFIPRLTENKWVRSITSVLDLYRTRWSFALYAVGVSFVLSSSFYLTFFAGLRALDQQVEATTILAVMPVVDVISSLPISISGLGVRERTLDFFLSQLTGIQTAAAVAASLIGFLFNLFWGLIGGLAIVTARHSVKLPELPEEVCHE